MPWLMIFCVLLQVGWAGAQTPAKKRTPATKVAAPKPKPDRFPLEQIDVTGNQIYTRDQILTITGLKVGQMAGESDFDAARERLAKTGAFQSVGFRSGPSASGKGYQVAYEVVEVPQVYPWRLEELPISMADVTRALSKNHPLFGDRIAGTKDMLSLYAGEISKLAGQAVVGKLVPDKDGQLYALFRPDKARPTVAEVHFKGNRILPEGELQRVISLAAVGSLYSDEFFRGLLDRNVRPLYDARGYVRVKFPKIDTAKPTDGVEGLVLTVEVEEGLPYQLAAISAKGAGPLDKDLTAALGVKTGEVVNFDKVHEGEQRAIAALRRRGYLKASSELERSYDDAKKTISVVVRVQPGDQFKFGSLKIEGLDILTEPGIRKMWGLKEGAPFNAEYPDKFLGRIKEDGVLDDLGETKSKVDIHEETKTADVLLQFKGTAAPVRRRRGPDVP